MTCSGQRARRVTGPARASDCAGLCAVAVPGLYRFVRFVRGVREVQKALISWSFCASARARNAPRPLHLLCAPVSEPPRGFDRE
jgi:hypothetical protein